MSYSPDFRAFVVKKIHDGMPRYEAIKFFNISRDSLYKWLKKHAETGELVDLKRKSYKPRKIDPALLKAAFDKTPDATLEEISEKFSCSHVAVWKSLKKLGITRKKNHALRGTRRGKKA